MPIWTPFGALRYTARMPKAKPMTIRLSEEGHALLEALASERGTSMTAQLEEAIRERAVRLLAKQQGVSAKPPPPSQ